jgi:ribonuclease P protein subunit RPR2
MSKKKISKDKKIQKKIAKRRINRLFRLAKQNALSNRLNLADRYIDLARKISMRYLITMPIEHKRRFCKHCYSYLLPHVTGRIRVHKSKIVIYCYNCKKYTRIPLKQSTD